MKKLIFASLTVLGVNYASAQTVNTQVEPAKPAAKEANLAAKIKADDDVRAERFAMRWKQLLGLNDEQYNKVVALKKEKIAEVKAVDAKYVGNENDEARAKELSPVSETYKKALKTIFTAEQYTKWEENVNMRFERWKTASTAQPNAPKQNETLQRIRIEME